MQKYYTVGVTPDAETDQSQPTTVSRCDSLGQEQRKMKLLDKLKLPALPPDELRCLQDYLVDHHDVFSVEEGERGETGIVQIEIDTEDSSPQKQPPKRMPFVVRNEVAKQLKQMQKSGVVQPSYSPWSSPVVMVKKRDGSSRFCVDYRGLNAVTKADTFPLPRIDDLLDQLSKARYFSTLDLASGFWQIQVEPKSREKTAFVTPHGLFEFRVMPFGLTTNAPAVFQRLIHKVLEGLDPEDGNTFVTTYLDDILVYSRTLEEHLANLQKVISRLRAANFKLKPSKCEFVRPEVEYLKHIITASGLRASPRVTNAVLEFP